MPKELKKFLVLTAGIVFLVLGVLGLALPFLQGVVFLIIGGVLLSVYFPKARFWVNEHTKKYPQLFSVINKVETWILKFIGEI